MYGIIYMHTCTINGKSYIGQTTSSMESRWKAHLYNKSKTKFTCALKKYNEKYWTHKILAYADNKEDLDDLEIFFIEKYDTINNGYNIRTGGARGTLTDEVKKIISEKRKGIGHPHTEVSKLKIKEALMGKPFSEIHKQNISKSKIGKKWSEKQKEIYRGKFSGKNNPNYGKKTSKETIKKMRETLGKKVLCIETGIVFSCAGEAAEYLGVKRCGIQRCLIKGGTSHGYHWQYL